ncbi:MAG: T9SS type A sorting domain-containing protein [Bacteroidales bacterium]|nr:T9SS type A sorting domain-containing protein [Bacteroidales bacterium]
MKASFTTNATSINVTEFVQFTSNSVNASSFLWDFSEGEKSTKENPIKYFYNAGTKNIRLTVTSDGSCKDSVVMQSLITVNGTTGVDDLSGKGFSVYPNPFASELVIETVDPGTCYIYLLNLDGKVMQSMQVENPGKVTLGCASLPSGIYLVKIQKGNDIKTLKVVKQ